MIEICAVAEFYEVSISIFERNDDEGRSFALNGTFKYSLNNSLTITFNILFTGSSHYDSLIDIVVVMNDNSCAFTGGHSNCKRFPANSDVLRAEAFCLKNQQNLEQFQKGNGDSIVTKVIKTTEANERKRLACSSKSESNIESPVMKRKRSLENEERRDARINYLLIKRERRGKENFVESHGVFNSVITYSDTSKPQ